MEIRRAVSLTVAASLVAPAVTPEGLAVEKLPKPWIMQVAIASSTAAVVKALDLITGRPLTQVEPDYRVSTISLA